MSFQWTKVPLLALVCGLCLSPLVGANAQHAAETFSVELQQSVPVRFLEDVQVETSVGAPVQQHDPGPAAASVLPDAVPPEPASSDHPVQPGAPLANLPSSVQVPGNKRIALLLPLRSATLGRAADAVRAGFFAAWERERQGIEVTLVDTGDAPQDVVDGYRNAAADHDIVVGPLTRSAATALVHSGEVMRPTVALTTPEIADDAHARVSPLMLSMGLSVEDEARQVAEWARRSRAAATAFVVHTPTAWQRRAARAFVEHWRGSGMLATTVELELIDGFLSPNSLATLRSGLAEASDVFLFAALDAGQARQLRESVGRQFPLYGTSQLNAVALPDRAEAVLLPEMEGAYLLDIPWQLQADHPAVMAYPRAPAAADQRRIADIERLYALGIDAYRVARLLAAESTQFELDGVTGRLAVRFDRFGPHFERTVQQAVYRAGSVVAVDALR